MTKKHTYPIAPWLLAMPRPLKRLVAVLHDGFFCGFTLWLALCLRLESWVPWSPSYTPAMVAAVLLALPLFAYFGLYRAVFRFAGWYAMLSLIRAISAYFVVYAFAFTVIGVTGVPRSVGIIQPLLMFLMLGISRVMVRFFLGDLYRRSIASRSLPGVVIYGAGAAGRQLASALRNGSEQRVVGFVDDNAQLHGQTVDGMRVHAPNALAELIARDDVGHVLLAMPSLGRKQRNAIVLRMRPLPVHVRTLPGVSALASGQVTLQDVQELDIADILGRDPVLPNPILLNRNVHGKVVLVTGAGGSIGSELCRQVLKCAPTCLVMVEMNEFSLYQIHRELEETLATLNGASPTLVARLGSAQNEACMDTIMATWQPNTVYHAAAYKHVPLVEHNPVEGLRNNVWGTLVCALAAARHGVQSFVLVSTDKAVRPTNIMGSSKRLAELVVQAQADVQARARAQRTTDLRAPTHSAFGTTFSIVRFGNVLGSSGSVVPLFRRQISQGGPITLTHPEVTRFFMTIPEAAELVVQAGAMATGGEVFVLEMGESVRVYDLACRMVELAGMRVRDADCPGGEIDIKITGLRVGEKLYEELLIGHNPQPTTHERVMKASEALLPWLELEKELTQLETAMATTDMVAVHAMLGRLVGYAPPRESLLSALPDRAEGSLSASGGVCPGDLSRYTGAEEKILKL